MNEGRITKWESDTGRICLLSIPPTIIIDYYVIFLCMYYPK
jgi:hypothetical protein